MRILSRTLVATVTCVLGVQVPDTQNNKQENTNASRTTALPTTTTTTTTEPFRISPEGEWDWQWLSTLEEPPVSYWHQVAQCETESNWGDLGTYAGGLGIALPTWNGYGGEEFARKQYKATIEEQIIVANRIALHGYRNSKGEGNQPVGFNGWGCIRNNDWLKPPVDNPWQAWRKYEKANHTR